MKALQNKAKAITMSTPVLLVGLSVAASFSGCAVRVSEGAEDPGTSSTGPTDLGKADTVWPPEGLASLVCRNGIWTTTLEYDDTWWGPESLKLGFTLPNSGTATGDATVTLGQAIVACDATGNVVSDFIRDKLEFDFKGASHTQCVGGISFLYENSASGVELPRAGVEPSHPTRPVEGCQFTSAESEHRMVVKHNCSGTISEDARIAIVLREFGPDGSQVSCNSGDSLPLDAWTTEWDAEKDNLCIPGRELVIDADQPTRVVAEVSEGAEPFLPWAAVPGLASSGIELRGPGGFSGLDPEAFCYNDVSGVIRRQPTKLDLGRNTYEVVTARE